MCQEFRGILSCVVSKACQSKRPSRQIHRGIKIKKLGVVVHAFSPSTCKAEASRSLEFKASLVYRVSSRMAKAIHRRTISEREMYKKSM